jgi:hypothetical protein
MEARAWDRLHDPEYSGGLNKDAFYELCKAAGYSEEASQKAAAERGWERAKRDLPP